MVMRGRSLSVEMEYNKQDISIEVEDFLENISFQDNLSGQADSISVSLVDRERRWLTKQWAPKKGDTLSVAVKLSKDWQNNEEVAKKLGDFEIDETPMSGPPLKVSIRGTSLPQSGSIKARKNKAWENTTLKKIANEIARNNGLTLYFSASDDTEYDRIDQDDQSDIAFLNKLTSDAGLVLKVSVKKIIIMSEQQLENESTVTGFHIDDADLKTYSGNDSLSSLYKSCRVDYTEPQTNKTISYTFTPKNPPKTGRVLIVNEEVKSESEAIKLAKSSLRNANKDGCTFSLKFAGFMFLYSGQCVDLDGFGTFNGKYIITSVSGSTGSGSETSIELRKVLEGY
ncbi:phage late control D family protein [Jeotgalibacillus terrae]|uniref:Phage late control D family protein n=1 Tax=Jeotgalibacillus terrae TaxID=587735 RepID=A0ABW5ZEP2_9BACL|nr:hypothetical protein [Jeotgalibacillus terrae]MBM7580003.1 hypothetical protein [Jeotgalibacillus terrae]